MGRPRGHGPGFEIRRREVIDVAAKLFALKGYAGTGIADLCAATGLAKGALYYYIGTKERLLIEIQNSVLCPLVAAARRIQSLDEDPILRLRLVSETLLEVIAHRIAYIRVVEHDLEQLNRRARAQLLTTRHDFESLVEGMLKEAMELGALRRTDPRLAMLQFFSMHNYTYQWLRPGHGWSPAFLSAEYCRTLFGGLCAPQYAIDDLEPQVDAFRAKYHGPSLSGLATLDSMEEQAG